MIKSIADANLDGKRVILRSDFNIPIENGIIRSFKKINDALPTINLIIKKGGIPIIISHLGRPTPETKKDLTLEPVADYFRGALDYNVLFSKDCISESTCNIVNNAKKGDIVFLENIRYYKEESQNDMEFARNLSRFGDVYCNNAFGTAHRAHSSTHAITSFFPNDKYAGLLIFKEIEYLEGALKEPKRPFTAIIGGSKISGKIDVIFSLFDKIDSLIIGGGMMFTFFKARGYEIGNSLVEWDKITLAKEILTEARLKDIKFYLPTDVIEADKFSNDANFRIVHRRNMSPGWMGLDIGPESSKNFSKIIRNSKTVLWNGPMGVFEMPNFAGGTLALARALGKCTKNGGITIVGGGDSARSIQQINYESKISHISTGGGASLELLEGKTLPAISALEYED